MHLPLLLLLGINITSVPAISSESGFTEPPRLPSYLFCSHVNPPSYPECRPSSVRCNSGASWWSTKPRRHVIKPADGLRAITRTSVKSSQRRSELLRSMRTTSRRAKSHSSRSEAGSLNQAFFDAYL